MTKQSKDDASAGFGGILGAIEKLAKLADDLQQAQGELNREGEVDLGKNAKVSYRFRARTLGDVKRESSPSDFKPFEKPASPKRKPSDVARDAIIEPETDVFVEGDAVVVYAQISGASESDIAVETDGERLRLHAKSATTRYQKDLTLPVPVQPKSLAQSYKNGILQVRLAIQQNV